MSKTLAIATVFVVLALGAGAAYLINQLTSSPQTQTPTTSSPPPISTATIQTTPPASQRGTLRGVSLSPRSYGGTDFASFFDKAKQAGSVVTWTGDWLELTDPKGAPYVVSQLATQNDLELVVIAQFFTQDTGTLLRPLNATVRKNYIDSAAYYASEYNPEYIGFGVEVNTLQEKSPPDYAAFVSLFRDVATAVRAASPDTKVFTVFQLERLMGLRGGLYGGINDPATNAWALLADFPSADLLAFTTYPCVVYEDPSKLAPNYYVEVASHTSKPVAFTEAGWFRDGPTGWESSSEEQAAFVAKYVSMTSPLEPQLLIWSFLYDQPVAEPFNTMGLLPTNGTITPSWSTWIRK